MASGSNVSNNHDIVSACVGLALNTMLLLLLWLEGANGPSLALFVGGIVELTGYTDWHAAVSSEVESDLREVRPD